MEAENIQESSIPPDTVKQSSIELIRFDKNHNLQYQGYCKVKINLVSKCLLVEPINENFKDIVGFEAFFKWKFIKQKNILFVFADFNYNDFALVFNNIGKCRKVYNGIFKNRESEKDFVNRKRLRNNFLKPFFKKIAENDFSKLKEIMEDWIQKHEGKEKEYYLKLLNKYNGNSNMNLEIKNVKQETEDYKPLPSRKRRFREINCGTSNADKDLSDSENFNSTNAENQCENETNVAPRKKQTILLLNEESTVIDESKFKIVNFKYQNALRQKLLIFTSSNKTKCYEYNFRSNKKYFSHRCREGKAALKAIMEEDCIKTENKQHICSPITYDPKNYVEIKIIKKPDYEILENCGTRTKKRLYVFNPNNQEECYEYFWKSDKKTFQCCGCDIKKKQIIAKIYHENTGKEYIRLLNDQHVCEFRKYDPEKHQQSRQFVLAPNFEIQTRIVNGIERKTLIIFDKNDRSRCYTYHYRNTSKTFYCNGCTKKRISAKICQNDDGENYVILSNFKHVCSLRPYVPQKETIIRSPKFKFLESNEEKRTSKVFIFNSNNPKMCYIFSQIEGKGSKRYHCWECRNLNKLDKTISSTNEQKDVILYLYKDDNDEYFVKMMDDQKHICKPSKYEPEKYETKVLKPKIDYILFREKIKNVDCLTMVVYHSEDKSLCFKYHRKDKYFHCTLCYKKKTSVTAKLHQDSNGNEYITGNQNNHICSPIKYSTIIKSDTVILEKSGLFQNETSKKMKVDESRIIQLPNFELQRNRFGVKDKRLIIFYNNERNLCYEYGSQNAQDSFLCKKCKSRAKLHKENEEKYIILGESKHKCKPVKYEEERKIIKMPDFAIFNRDDKSKLTKLIIFASPTKEMSYEYTFIQRSQYFRCCGCYALKKNVSTKLLKNNDGEEYVYFLKTEHVCKPKELKLKNFQLQIIPESGFKIFCNQNGRPNSKLIVFDSKKDGYGFEYFVEKNNLFICNRCNGKKKRVTARVCQNENGENYVELSTEEHICKSEKLEPEKYTKNKAVKFNNFVVHYSISGDRDSRITIFDENDKYLGYRYNKYQNLFRCHECTKMDKSVSAKLFIDKDGIQSLELSNKKHVCSIQNLLQNELISNSFDYEENGNALIANVPNENGKYYKFKYDEKLSVSCCVKCKEMKKVITATVCKNNDGKEFLLFNDVHCCILLPK